jgi:NAD(P)-dependent dehydrogenase (short-subunit alcohol dehydrogenase family)
MEIAGHAALISGGASGLGAATARALAAGGAKVALLDRDGARAQALAAEIGGLAVICDVTDAVSLEAAVASAAASHGPARIAVACAGVAPGAKVVGRNGAMALDDFARVIEINLTGTFNLVRLAAAGMAGLDPLADGERGVIVTTASIAAEDGQIGQAAYAASKGGVAAMTLPIARELARFGIRIVSIAPGLFATPMMLGLPQEVQDSLGASVPFPPRLGDPTEYAALALHVIANPMLNGATIRLDGALRMPPK